MPRNYQVGKRRSRIASSKLKRKRALSDLGSRLNLSTNKRLKMASSRTKTKTKTKNKRQVISNENANISKSKCFLKYPPMKMIKKGNAPKDVYRYRLSGSTVGALGRQAYGVVVSMTSADEIKQSFLQSIDTTTAAQTAMAPNANSEVRKIYMDYAKAETHITNQGPSSVFISMYDCIARVDNAYNPNDAWNIGLTQERGITGTEEGIDNVGARPEDVKYFASQWKILKKTEITLGTGANHVHKVHHSYNGLLNYNKAIQLISQTGVGRAIIKGLTIVSFMVVTGMPVDSINTTTTTTPDVGTVTTNMSKIIHITNYEYGTRLLSVKARHVSYPTYLTQPAAAYGQNVDSQGGFESVTNTLIASAFT